MINARRLAAKKAAIRQRARSANLFVPAPVPAPSHTYPLILLRHAHLIGLAGREGERERIFSR